VCFPTARLVNEAMKVCTEERRVSDGLRMVWLRRSQLCEIEIGREWNYGRIWSGQILIILSFVLFIIISHTQKLHPYAPHECVSYEPHPYALKLSMVGWTFESEPFTDST
jgi:hypothetical protein